MANRILITGGAGFIGFHLANLVAARGDGVVLADNFSRGILDPDLEALVEKPNVSLIELDLLNERSLEKLPDDFDYIYHFAAVIGVQHVLEQPYRVLVDNTMMLAAAIKIANRQSNLKRFVFTSTSEVYAGTLRHFEMDIPTPETTPLTITPTDEPRTSYMLSKIYGEAMCHHSGIPHTIVRPHNFYGPRMGLSHVIPELLKRAHSLQDGDEFEVFSVDHSRTFIYISDAVELISKAAESADTIGEALNIGNEAPEVKMGALAEIILKVVGRNLTLAPQPETPGSPRRRCPNMSKTIEMTGYTPEVDLESGVQKTFSWYQKHIFEGSGPSAT